MVHFGEAQSVPERRQLVLDAAYQAHAPGPLRAAAAKTAVFTSEVWINTPIPDSQTTKESGVTASLMK